MWTSSFSNQSSPLVYIIVLNWNSWNYTAECVLSLQKLEYPNYQIVLIDNASSDSSEQLLREHFPELPFLQTGSNLGYAGGNNCGITYALERNAEFIWILNNDTLVEVDTLQHLIDVMQNNVKAAACCPKIYYMGSENEIAYAGGNINYWRGAVKHRGLNEIDRGQYDQLIDVEFLTGSSLLVRSSVLEQTGLMLEEYFLFFEDVEWSLRFRRHNFELIFVPSAIVWHKEGGSTGGSSGRLIKPDPLYYLLRNGLYLYRSYFPGIQRWTAQAWVVCLHMAFLVHVFRRKRLQFPILSQAVFQALMDYLKNIKGKRIV
jgi:GT2 family glycosyltransferase